MNDAEIVETTAETATAGENGQEYEADEAIAREIEALVQELMDESPLDLQAQARGRHGRYVELDLAGSDSAYLVNKRDMALDSLQYLINMIVMRKLQTQARVVLDAGGYRKRREENLRNHAVFIAHQVKQRGEEALLAAMPSHERRIIHNALKDDPEVETYSEGAEPERRVVITPKKKGD